MSKSQQLDHDELIQRISRDLADSYDEELEMEIEDRHPLPDAPARDILLQTQLVVRRSCGASPDTG